MKKSIIITFFFLTSFLFSQNKITGNVYVKEVDSIFFLPRLIDTIYFETPIIKAEITSTKFNLKKHFTYPQMYFLKIKKKDSKNIFCDDFCFLDSSTKKIQIDSFGIASINSSKTQKEYINTFSTYFLKEKKDIKMLKYFVTSINEFRLKLPTYIIDNNNSYVALWFLIMDFNENGYFKGLDEMLNSFSSEMQNEYLWKTLKNQITNIRIKEGNKFPKLYLKNKNLHLVQLNVNSKYTLVDYWFSRCKPCLKQFPKLKEMYTEYKSKGFNIISISTDRTMDVELWKKRIDENELYWDQYLDENGKEAFIDKIISFPTNFLIDEKGNVIQKNIDLDKLEKLLKENLK